MTTWQLGQKCAVYSKRTHKWYNDGEISYIDDKITVLFNNGTKWKKFHKTSKNVVPITPENLQLDIGSSCLIYSITEWCHGVVTDIYDDSQCEQHYHGINEWLKIRYYDEQKMLTICDIRRHSVYLQLFNGKSTTVTPIESLLNYSQWIKLSDIPKFIQQAQMVAISDIGMFKQCYFCSFSFFYVHLC